MCLPDIAITHWQWWYSTGFASCLKPLILKYATFITYYKLTYNSDLPCGHSVSLCCVIVTDSSSSWFFCCLFWELYVFYRLSLGTTAAAPLPFRAGNPALCGSHPLVTPYYGRLGDLLCFVFMSAYCMFDLSVYYMFLQYFDTVGWVFWAVKTVSHITYTVLAGT